MLFFYYFCLMAFNGLKKLISGIDKIQSGRFLFIDAANFDIVKSQMIDLNQEQMEDFGVDSKGETLGEYSEYTKIIKQKKGQSTDHITLKDTEEFYNSMHVVFGGDSIFISADMIKPDTDLESIYPFALGLTEENKRELIPEIKERIIDLINKYFGR